MTYVNPKDVRRDKILAFVMAGGVVIALGLLALLVMYVKTPHA